MSYWRAVEPQPQLDDGQTLAPEPCRWVCTACGKTSRTRYGYDRDNKQCSERGWDASCMTNAVLCEPAMVHVP